MFKLLGSHSKLFNHSDDEAIHIALASLLNRVISSDHKESKKEKHEFFLILSEEFDLNSTQISTLYNKVKGSDNNLADDLDIIAGHLKLNPNLRMQFMSKLNHLITLDGVTSNELEVFHAAQKALFPEITSQNEF